MTSLMTWLVPAVGPERDRLVATIDRLAAEHDAPRFQPHVTMVTTFDSDEDAAVHTLKSLVANVPPFDVTFSTLGHEEAYFRALYLLAEPSAQLTALHQAGQRAWALAPSPYRPHLSLLYSDLTEEQKRPIIDTIDILLPLTVHIDAAELWVRGHPEVRNWYRTARMPLGASPATSTGPSTNN
jgi:2'-5' RNA ligase